MVGISPEIKKINFGADVSPISLPIIPAPVSSNPIQERYGYMENNLYGTPDNQPLERYPEYDRYVPRKNEEYKSNLVSVALMAGGIGAAGFLLFLGIKKLVSSIKNNKKEQQPQPLMEETVYSNKDITPPRDRMGINRFNKIADDAMKKFDNQEFDKIKLSNLRVLFSKSDTVEDKKAALAKLYEFADVYKNNDRQPQVYIRMSEEIEHKSDYITDMFRQGSIEKVEPKFIEKIKSFQIINANRSGRSERHDMVVYKEVEHGINGSSVIELGRKWFRNAGEWLRKIF